MRSTKPLQRKRFASSQGWIFRWDTGNYECMNETAALTALIAAANGKAGAEPVTALAIATISPWSGNRVDIRDRPNRIAPSSERELVAFLSSVQTQLSPKPSPADRGLLGWLRHKRRALPIKEIPSGPSWLTDEPLLADGWVSLPPAGRHTLAVVSQDVIAVDARLGFLHLLAQQAGPEAPREAVTVLAEYFAGIRSAGWTDRAAELCPTMVIHPTALWAWTSTVQGLPVDAVVTLLTGPPLVPSDWTVPPPTAEEIAAEERRQRLIADGKKADAEWNARYRVGNRATAGRR